MPIFSESIYLKYMVWHKRFFALLLVLLPTQLGVHFWPDWAMVLGRRVDYLAPTVYLTDMLLLVTLSSWLLESFPRIRNPFDMPQDRQESARLPARQGIRKKQNMLTSFIIPFLVFVGLNVFVAHNQYVAVYKWLKVAEFVGLGWYIVRTRPKLSAISYPLSVGIFYSSVLAIVQFFFQHSIGGPLWWIGERTFDAGTPGIARIDSCQLSAFSCQQFLRSYATFPHPNVLGGFLAVTLPLLLNLRIYESTNLPMDERMRRMVQWGLGITMVLGVIALILSFSRSAMVVGGVAIVLAIARITNFKFQIMEHKINFPPFILYTLLVILLLTVFVKTDLREESVAVRQQLNSAAVKLWQSSPLLGVGLGNFLVRLPEALSTRTIYFLQPVHNIYLLVLAETGVVGVGLIVLWIALQSQKWRVHSVKKNKKKIYSEFFTLHSSLITLLLLGLVDHYPLTLQQGQLLLTLLVAMSLREVREVRDVQKVREVKK